MTRAGVRFLAGLLVALVLMSSTLAVSSLHHHSHQPGHSGDDSPCGLCFFAHGKFVADGGVPAQIRVPLRFVELGGVIATVLPDRIEYRWSPSRAPPA